MNYESQAEEDRYWMKKALRFAEKAAQNGEVPVAALIVSPEGLLAKAINNRERKQSPLGHAELLALFRASQKRNSWRLSDCTLYVTLEPCPMCAGAIQQSRLKRVVFGAHDAKGGGAGSVVNLLQNSQLNHQCEVTSGIMALEAEALLKKFFQEQREIKKIDKSKMIYRERASVVVIHNQKILGFHAEDPSSLKNYFFIPGGAIDKDETPEECAVRECLEETGYKIQIDSETELIREYSFHWNSEDYFCKTYFYLGFLAEDFKPPQEVQDAGYHRGADWLPLKDSIETFSYHQDIQWAVRKLIKRHAQKSTLR